MLLATVFEGLTDVGWSGTATLEVATMDYDTIALGKRHVEELLAAVRQGRPWSITR